MNTHDWHNYFGPLMGWLVNAMMWLIGGMSPLAAIGAVAALWWTIERAKTERAKRRMIEDVEAEVSRGGLSVCFFFFFITEPAALK